MARMDLIKLSAEDKVRYDRAMAQTRARIVKIIEWHPPHMRHLIRELALVLDQTAFPDEPSHDNAEECGPLYVQMAAAIYAYPEMRQRLKDAIDGLEVQDKAR